MHNQCNICNATVQGFGGLLCKIIILSGHVCYAQTSHLICPCILMTHRIFQLGDSLWVHLNGTARGTLSCTNVCTHILCKLWNWDNPKVSRCTLLSMGTTLMMVLASGCKCFMNHLTWIKITGNNQECRRYHPSQQEAGLRVHSRLPCPFLMDIFPHTCFLRNHWTCSCTCPHTQPTQRCQCLQTDCCLSLSRQFS